MPNRRTARLEQEVRSGAERLRKLRLAEESVRGAENARATGREEGLGRSPGEGDPLEPALPPKAPRRRSALSKPPTSAGGFVHVDISADDPARAARFFETVFGWRAQELPGATPYWLLLAGDNGTHGVGAGIGKRDHPSQSVMPTIEVPSAEEYATRIKEAGGVVVTPGTHLSGVGILVVFKDTEGNVFGILEPTRTAGPAPRSRRPR